MTEEIRQMVARINELRDISGFSEKEVADALNIEVAQYKLYEQGEHDLPISVVFKLAGLFNVDMNEILTGQTPHLNTYCIHRSGDGLKVERHQGYYYRTLANTFRDKMMESMIVTMEPSAEAAMPDRLKHEGQEFNYCLQGTMELLFDNKIITLNKGDSIYFDPSHPHAQRAIGETAKFLTVIAQKTKKLDK